jgi:undecaprenyl-diphosphatase
MSLQTLDTKLLLFVNHGMANDFFDVLMPFLSAQGYLLVLPFLLFLALISSVRRNEKKRTYLPTALWTFVISCLSVLFVEWLEPVLKNSIARIRPCRWVEGIRLIVACPKSFSMPSGHAISSFAFAAPLFYLTRHYLHPGWRLIPFLLAALIAFSRVYLGVHYPSDVLAGALLGTATGMALSLFYEFCSERVPT